MTVKTSGACLCGAIMYVVHGDFEMSGNCHCNTCKKSTGGAFESFAVIDDKNFELLQGQAALVEFRISAKVRKHFCGTCGTPIFNRHRLLPGKRIVHIGSLDEPRCVSPAFNLHCENMLPWVPGISDIKSFEKDFKG